MRPITVVVAQSDPRAAEALAASLYPHFSSIQVARDAEEIRHAIPKHRADLAIVDLELVPIQEVCALHREFETTTIVCNHRLADEEMWTSTLEAGAADCCITDDVKGIVESALRNLSFAKRRHAAA